MNHNHHNHMIQWQSLGRGCIEMARKCCVVLTYSGLLSPCFRQGHISELNQSKLSDSLLIFPFVWKFAVFFPLSQWTAPFAFCCRLSYIIFNHCCAIVAMSTKSRVAQGLDLVPFAQDLGCLCGPFLRMSFCHLILHVQICTSLLQALELAKLPAKGTILLSDPEFDIVYISPTQPWTGHFHFLDCVHQH